MRSLRLALILRVGAEAGNGEQAILKTLETIPDLIILDISMPNLDGLLATQKLKALLPSVPIILLSIHDGPEIVSKAQQVGAQAFVTKSEVGCVLLQAVDSLKQGQAFFLSRPGDAPCKPK